MSSRVSRAQHQLGRGIADFSPAAFENFLDEFKTSPEQQITDALGNIDIDEDSDEYDFMDDEETQNRRHREKARSRTPQHKYRDLLQKLADRKADEVVIDLDDLATVSPINLRDHSPWHTDQDSSTKSRSTSTLNW